MRAIRSPAEEEHVVTESPQHLHVAFQDAFTRHDLDAIVALYEPRATLVTSDGSVQGAAAIREAYRGFLAARPTIDLQTLAVSRAGNWPCCTASGS